MLQLVDHLVQAHALALVVGLDVDFVAAYDGEHGGGLLLQLGVAHEALVGLEERDQRHVVLVALRVEVGYLLGVGRAVDHEIYLLLLGEGLAEDAYLGHEGGGQCVVAGALLVEGLEAACLALHEAHVQVVGEVHGREVLGQQDISHFYCHNLDCF